MRIATRPSIVLSGAALLLVCAAAGRLLAASDAQQPAAAAVQSTDVFESRVRPVLLTVCGDCHTDDEKGGLRIDSRAALLKGGEHGPAIVPGDPEKSLLISRSARNPASPKMPKKAARS